MEIGFMNNGAVEQLFETIEEMEARGGAITMLLSQVVGEIKELESELGSQVPYSNFHIDAFAAEAELLVRTAGTAECGEDDLLSQMVFLAANKIDQIVFGTLGMTS